MKTDNQYYEKGELKNEMSPRIAKIILNIRDACLNSEKDLLDEVWHNLYEIISPDYDKLSAKIDKEWEDIKNISLFNYQLSNLFPSPQSNQAGEQKSAEEILSELTSIPIYRLRVDDKGEYIVKSVALEAMKEFAAQRPKQSNQDDIKDITFLREMKQHAENAFEKKDVTSKEMLLKMINDWIDELESDLAKLKEGEKEPILRDDENICPKCKNKERPDYNCDLCNGIGFIDKEPCIILHGGQPLNDLIFNSDKEARNYIKMQYPKRKFIEPQENVFIDKFYGAKFKIIILKSR
jgi:hypothetical protein